MDRCEVVVESGNGKVVVILVVDTQATTKVQVLYDNTLSRQIILDLVDADGQVAESGHIGDLGADVAMDTD